MLVCALGLGIIMVAIRILGHRTTVLDGSKRPRAYGWFESGYLAVHVLVMGSDWLQGPYVYDLYHQYGYGQAQIAQFFLCGFGSSMVAGTIIASLADKFGRKSMCQLFALIYFISTVLKQDSSYVALIVSRLLSGVATSILFSSFESWLITEHHARAFPAETLPGTFSKATTANGITAICAGVVANLAHDRWGPAAPFDVSAILLVISFVVISVTWNENYGDPSSQLQASFSDAIHHLGRSRPTQILGVVQPLFESSMYIFVFMWTPALKTAWSAPSSLSNGWIFACFMISTMIGSSVFALVTTRSRYGIESWAPVVFVIAAAALAVPALSQQYAVRLGAFFVFEACCGVFWPMMGTLRARYIPDAIRSTTMNLFRVPLNCIVLAVLVLLERLTASAVWMICSTMLMGACIVQNLLRCTTTPGSTTAEAYRKRAL